MPTSPERSTKDRNGIHGKLSDAHKVRHPVSRAQDKNTAPKKPSDRIASNKHESMEANRLARILISDLPAHPTLPYDSALAMIMGSRLHKDNLRKDISLFKKYKKDGDLLSLRLHMKYHPTSREENYREKRAVLQQLIKDLRSFNHPDIDSAVTLDALTRLSVAVPALIQALFESAPPAMFGRLPQAHQYGTPYLLAFRTVITIGSDEMVDYLTADYSRTIDLIDRYAAHSDYEKLMRVVEERLEHGALSGGVL